MIAISVIPAATASATAQSLAVEITEPTCKSYCLNSNAMPSASVIFTLGTVTEINNTAIAPVTATITIVSPNGNNCGCAHTQVITEQFTLAFAGTTNNTVTITPGANSVVVPANIKCCKANGIKLTTTLDAAIA